VAWEEAKVVQAAMAMEEAATVAWEEVATAMAVAA